jgi:nucleoid DNA-binding protein
MHSDNRPGLPRWSAAMGVPVISDHSRHQPKGGLIRMKTTTKKDLIERIASQTKQRRTAVKRTVQCFLHNVINDLRAGHRIEFRDFGVFETRQRAPRVAQNPKTMERVPVPARKTVKFKVGRLMKQALDGNRELSLSIADDDDE